MREKQWFETWFDTDYYHILYRNRNEEEAEQFIEKLVDFLSLKPGAHVLDLACGKGRHSSVLNKMDLDVLGVDLSKNSISTANLLAKNGLQFLVHDMREIIPNSSFDAVFNLFTSFGYFNDYKDNFKVINSIHSMLKPNGIVVIDFLNLALVKKNLVRSESNIIDGIQFDIHREIDENFIRKRIKITHKKNKFEFEEKVQALELDHFVKLLENKFHITHILGNYALDKWDENSSNRLILVGKKIE